jgi:hypothetical protein
MFNFLIRQAKWRRVFNVCIISCHFISEQSLALRLKQPRAQTQFVAYISGEGVAENSWHTVHDFGGVSVGMSAGVSTDAFIGLPF